MDSTSTTAALADHDQIVLAAIALASMLAAALVYLVKGYGNSKTAAEQSTAANHAVNGMGPDQDHRIWNKVNRIEIVVDKLIAQQEDFLSHGWGNLPPDMDDAVSLTEKIRALEHGQHANTGKLDTLIDELRTHVEWEMKQKYYEDKG